MFDIEYFFGSGKVDSESYMLKSRFSNDLISLVKKGYLIDFFGKLPMNDQQLKIMNLFLNDGDYFYDAYSKASVEQYGKGISVKDKIMKAYFSVYSVLQNLCLDCNYGDNPTSDDRLITSNIGIVKSLMDSGKLCISKDELTDLMMHLDLEEVYVVDGIIPIVAFYETSSGEYRLEIDFFELCEFTNRSEIVIPVHLVALYLEVLIHILFSASKVTITYVDGSEVRRINTKMDLAIHKDSGFKNHYITMYDIDCYKTGSPDFVPVDVLSILDIKIYE